MQKMMMASRRLLQLRLLTPAAVSAVGLAQREGHGKRYLEHLVARGVARAGEDLVAKRLVEVGHAHHAGACQALLVKELLQVGRERRGRKVVPGHVAVYARRVQELGEKLLGQLLLRLWLRHARTPLLPGSNA